MTNSILGKAANFTAVLGLFMLSIFQGASSQQATKLGEIKGKITVASIPDGARERVRIDRYGTHKSPNIGSQTVPTSSPAYKLSEKGLLFLEGDHLRNQKFQPPTVHPIMNQKDLMFYPQVLPIFVGTIVDFPNGDPLFHNVFSYSQPKEFDLGRYPTGDSRSVRFDRPGIVRVYCDIHAHMNATIIVLDNPYFATPDENGNYAIKNIPEGMYVLKFWLGREVIEERPVVIKNGETVTVHFNR